MLFNMKSLGRLFQHCIPDATHYQPGKDRGDFYLLQSLEGRILLDGDPAVITFPSFYTPQQVAFYVDLASSTVTADTQTAGHVTLAVTDGEAHTRTIELPTDEVLAAGVWNDMTLDTAAVIDNGADLPDVITLHNTSGDTLSFTLPVGTDLTTSGVFLRSDMQLTLDTTQFVVVTATNLLNQTVSISYPPGVAAVGLSQTEGIGILLGGDASLHSSFFSETINPDYIAQHGYSGYGGGTTTIGTMDVGSGSGGDMIFVGTVTSDWLTQNQSAAEPVVTVSRSRNASETKAGSSGQGRFTFSRSGSTSLPLMVYYSVSGSAASGADYNSIGRSIEIPAGKRSVTLYVTPVDDASAETNETVTVTLDSATVYAYGVSNNASKQSATVTIADNEPTVSIKRSRNANETKADTSGTGYFTVTRSGGDVSQPLTVHFDVGGAATLADDYVALGDSIEIPAGQKSVKLYVVPVNDAVAEATEDVVVTLAADESYRLDAKGSKQSAVVTIADNEPTLSIKRSRNANETKADTSGTGYFTITRSGGDVSQPLTVHFDVSGAATSVDDYGALGDSIEIPAGQKSVKVYVVPVDDAMAEATEDVIVTLAADESYRLDAKVSKQSAVVTIADNEPIVSITRGRNASEVKPDTSGQGYFTIARSGGDMSQSLTVYYSVGGSATPGVDYSRLSGSITMFGGQKSCKLYVTPVDDMLPESAEDVSVTLTGDSLYRLDTNVRKQSAVVKIAERGGVYAVRTSSIGQSNYISSGATFSSSSSWDWSTIYVDSTRMTLP